MSWSASLPFFSSLIISLALIPFVRELGFRVGRVALPREDRWHKKPTPTLGGIAIFLSFGAALLLAQYAFHSGDPRRWGFLAGSVLLFLAGLYDEFKPITPIAKLVVQILAATLVIAMGYTSTFFNPHIPNAILAQLPNILLTYIWLVGITNAINLLDNMDGLAGGIALISAAILGYFFWRDGNISLLWISIALAGGILGFLVFNFPPARIFMGDSGSLFLGFTLAGLAIAQQQQASNVFAVIAVPTLIFMLPILDTALVTITRLMRGQSPAQGGRDHTSHRLVAFGLSERQALFVLYGVALFSAIMAAVLESINYWMSLVLAPLLVLSLALLAAYLGRLKVVAAPSPSRSGQTIARWMTDLTYRRRIPEVILDFFLIGIIYYLSFLAGYSLQMNQLRLSIYLSSLPLAVAGAYLSFYLFGVYRVVWRYASFDDLIRYFQAALGAVALLAASIFVLDSTNLADWTREFAHRILAYYGIFLLIGLAFTRSSFKLLDTLFQQRTRPDETPILIVGAGDMGELALRWILMNPQMKYRPVGFIDSDPLLTGRYIHGVKVLGGMRELPNILERFHIAGLVLAEVDGGEMRGSQLAQICQPRKCWVRQLRLDMEPLQDFIQK
jgi:UDP-GlcNAc:undecaprenyl-phosphate GlcNAc-1-phosphate transferase